MSTLRFVADTGLASKSPRVSLVGCLEYTTVIDGAATVTADPVTTNDAVYPEVPALNFVKFGYNAEPETDTDADTNENVQVS